MKRSKTSNPPNDAPMGKRFNRHRCWVLATVAIATILSAPFMTGALAQSRAVPLPVPAPKSPSAASLTAPSHDKPAVKPDVWSASAIADAKRLCHEALKSMSAKFVPLPPVKKGNCGAPAPVRLISIGKKHPVRFEPAPTVSCRMLKPLNRWIKKALQPRAADLLDARVASVSIMSSYSCRTRYGRKGARMSEHAFANALDVGGFRLVDGRRVSVLKDWGLTRRDIAKFAESAKLKKSAKVAAAAAKVATTRSPNPSPKPTGAANRRQTTLPPVRIDRRHQTTAPSKARGAEIARRQSNGRPARRVVTRAAPAHEGELQLQTSRRTPIPPWAPANAPTPGTVTQTAVPPLPTRRPLRKAVRRRANLDKAKTKRTPQFKSPPFRLGGPQPPASRPRALFLRGIHRAACGIFGTTLGPEANEAHRNHFHFDMFPRRRSKYCE